MNRGPDIKTLSLVFEEEDAKVIKFMMNQGTNPIRVLEVADFLKGTHGVEDLYPDHPNFYYVNTGDTYNSTLCHDGKRFFVGSWGDWIEAKDLKRVRNAKKVSPYI